MDQDITIDTLRAMAKIAGLDLSDDELQRLLPGVNRSKKQVGELRDWVAADNEPASTFDISSVIPK